MATLKRTQSAPINNREKIMMQSSQKVEEIVQYKTHLIGNKKVIEDMQIALNDMQQDDKINKHYAFFGLTVLIPIIIYISFLFLI